MQILTQKIDRPNAKPVYLTIRAPEGHRGLVFIQPGDGGRTSAPHNQAIVDAYLGARYVTVLIDNADPSDPNAKLQETQYPEDPEQAEALLQAVTAEHVACMEAAIDHVVPQFDFTGRYAVAGHSRGGYSGIALAAKRGPEQIEHVLACAPSGLSEFIDTPGVIRSRLHLVVGAEDHEARSPAKMLYKRLAETARGVLDVIDSADHLFHGAEDMLRASVEKVVAEHPGTGHVDLPGAKD